MGKYAKKGTLIEIDKLVDLTDVDIPSLLGKAGYSVVVKSSEGGFELGVQSSELRGIISKAVSYPIVEADDIIKGDASGGDIDFTLPIVSSVPIGKEYTIKNIGASGTVDVITNLTAEKIDGLDNLALTTQWDVLRVVSDGTNWLIL